MPELRPLERVVMRLHGSGASLSEISSKVGKKPGTVRRILDMVDLKVEEEVPSLSTHQTLRPIERVVVRLRDRGESYGEIGNRLGKSGRQVRRIEGYAAFKLGG